MPYHLKYRNRNSLFRYICSKGKNPSDPVVEAPLYHLPRSGRSVLNIGKMQSSTLSSACKPFAARPEVIGIGYVAWGRPIRMDDINVDMIRPSLHPLVLRRLLTCEISRIVIVVASIVVQLLAF